MSILCGRVLNSSDCDLQLALTVSKFLNATNGYSLHFDSQQSMAYCDAAYGIDKEYRSRNGIVMLYAGAPEYVSSHADKLW